MNIRKVQAEHLDEPIQKAVETVPADLNNFGPLIEEKELEGWRFVDSKNKHGFTHLYFTRLS